MLLAHLDVRGDAGKDGNQIDEGNPEIEASEVFSRRPGQNGRCPCESQAGADGDGLV